jgi:ribosomal protein L33
MSGELLVMRLADMGRIHPQQDNTKFCSNCNERVGIYPTGQAWIKKNPKTKLICSICVDKNYSGRTVAPMSEMARESRETRPREEGDE